MSDLRFEPGAGEDPCAVFIKGFPNSVKPSEVSDYFYDKGYHNRITYQKTYPNYYRLFMALRFDSTDTAKEVCEKYSNSILFGYKVHLSFFRKNYARINNIFMQDKLRKLRAQATRRPFTFRHRFYGHHSPARTFKARPRRRSRSSSSDSDRSLSPDPKRRTRSRDSSISKRRRHRSHSRSRSSRSTSRSETPTRFSPSSSNSKRSASSSERSTDHVRKLCSKVTVVENTPKKFSEGSSSSKERLSITQELNSPTKRKQGALLSPPHKERFMNNFSPVSMGSDDDGMLMTPTPDRTAGRDAQATTHPTECQREPSGQSVSSYFTQPIGHRKGGEAPEAWANSEGESTPDGSTPSPRGPGLSPRQHKQSNKQSHSVYGKVGSFMEIKATDRPWQLKPLTVQDEGSAPSANNKQIETPSYCTSVMRSPASQNGTHSNESALVSSRLVVQNSRAETTYISSPSSNASSRQPSLSSPTRPQPHPHEGAWSPNNHRLQSPTSSIGASPPKVNGMRKQGSNGKGEWTQAKLEKLQAKKEEIIRAYKQDCDTFATVVRMLIRKDPELEQRLQQALRENLTEIGQRCVQELQEVVEQMRD